MSNIRAITGSTKIMNRPTHGGSKKQGIPSSTNLNTWSHVAFRNRNVVCACNRHVVFCMNQLGGVGAGGIPGRSYAFAPGADGVNKNKILCGIDHSNIPIHILQKISYPKLLSSINNNNNENIVIFTFNSNILYVNDAFHIISPYLKPNKHYVIKFVNNYVSKYTIFFTIVKNVYTSDSNMYKYDIKNVSPDINLSVGIDPNFLIPQNNFVYTLELYEVVTKYN